MSDANVMHRRAQLHWPRQQLPQVSALAAPLTALCSPQVKFTWGPAEQLSFNTLKAVLTSAQVLHVWDQEGRRACSRTPRSWPCRLSWSSPTMRALSIPSPSSPEN